MQILSIREQQDTSLGINNITSPSMNKKTFLGIWDSFRKMNSHAFVNLELFESLGSNRKKLRLWKVFWMNIGHGL